MLRTLCRCVAVLVVVFAPSARAQPNYDKVEIKSYHVAGAVHMLEGQGGNIGVSVGPDGILIIDDQYAPLSDKIKVALQKLGSDKPRFILNTHWHGDHVGGNEAFGKDGTIIAHENVRARLATKQELFGKPVEPLAKVGLPIITFNESLTLHFNGEDIRVVHFPRGHTDGDCVIFFTGSKVVHMGDHLFAGMFPFVDLEHGGDVQGMADNVARIIAELSPEVKTTRQPGVKTAPEPWAVVRIIPGHGPLSTLDDLKSFHQMLTGTLGVVKAGIAAGKSFDQIKSEGLPEKWKSWGQGFIKTDVWMDTLYRSATKK